VKDLISHSASLGNVPPSDQRLFYLGRELKNAGRSLERLGIGQRYGIGVIHVHSRSGIHRSRTPSPAGPKGDGPEIAVGAGRPRHRRQETSDSVVFVETRKQRRHQQPQQTEAIELLDSDDEDEDGEEFDQMQQHAQRSKRQRVS